MRRYISQAHRHIAITQLREVEASNVTENARLPVLRLWSVQMVHRGCNQDSEQRYSPGLTPSVAPLRFSRQNPPSA